MNRNRSLSMTVLACMLLSGVFGESAFSKIEEPRAQVGAASPMQAAVCGKERWAVKIGTDSEASSINLAPTPTNIVEMRKLNVPRVIPPDSRASQDEKTVWLLTEFLTGYKLEADQDYHLVVSDANGKTMIAEIPSPACLRGTNSPFASDINSSRSKFDFRFQGRDQASAKFRTLNPPVPVKIKGVGFFDKIHGQTGVAPNGIELHPVLDIDFDSGPVADFGVTISPPTLTINQGDTNATAIHTVVLNGFNSALTLSAVGLPSGVTASFVPTEIPAPGNGIAILKLTVSQAATTRTYSFTVVIAGGQITHSESVTLTIAPSSSQPPTLVAPTPAPPVTVNPTDTPANQWEVRILMARTAEELLTGVQNAGPEWELVSVVLDDTRVERYVAYLKRLGRIGRN